MGAGTYLFSYPFALEAQLVKVGSNCTISAGVLCITHDNAIGHHIKGKSDIFGRVTIGDNCFIGTGTYIMYGVSIGNNVVIGAGSVVVHSVPDNVVVAGNPAKIICTVDEYANKYRNKAVSWSQVENKMIFFADHEDLLVKR